MLTKKKQEKFLFWELWLKKVGFVNSSTFVEEAVILLKENKLASYPLSIWTEGDIWNYIRTYKVDICSLYKNPKCRRTGCMFCGFGAHREYPSISRFALLYETHPNLYKVFMNYTNNNVTYREALHKVGISLPDEN